jgi:hypothetical protein
LTSGIDLILATAFQLGRMARPHIREEPSPYYPPRARWYAPFFYLGNVLRRRLALDRLTLPREMKTGALLAGFFVPGLAVWLRGPRLWGRATLAGSALLMMIFIVCLGQPPANLAFGLLISLHATGLVYYCNPLLAGEPFRARLGFTFLTLLAIGLLLYLPARSFVQAHWLTPLRLNGHVVVVQRNFPARHLQRGDWMAYTLDENGVGDNYHGGWIVLQNGLCLGPVLALAGDRVVFSNECFSVNGILHTNLPHMPVSGGWTVPENHWFIWPNLGISGHGNVGEARISSAMMGLADVAETNFFGKPFRHWFWREQKLP